MAHEVLFEARNHVGLITLNRAAALNALSHTMVQEMYTQLRAWARDVSIYAVVVKGSGNKAFCAGGDVRAVRASFIASTNMHREFFVDEYRLDHFIHRFPKPYIALMDGIVMGGGMGIAQGASLRVVTDRTRMAMPEVAIGFFPDVGASFFLSRLPAALAAYLGLSGTTIGGADAVYAGLADLYVPGAALDGLDTALAALRWGSDHAADIHGVVRALRAGDSPRPALADLRPAIDLHFSHLDIQSVTESLRI
jgi:enoyl-CoA hydratase/carnithine racemase